VSWLPASLTSLRDLMKKELLTPSGLFFWAKKPLLVSPLIAAVVVVHAQTDPGPRSGTAGAGGAD
jgi:hypothetical protein